MLLLVLPRLTLGLVGILKSKQKTLTRLPSSAVSIRLWLDPQRCLVLFKISTHFSWRAYVIWSMLRALAVNARNIPRRNI